MRVLDHISPAHVCHCSTSPSQIVPRIVRLSEVRYSPALPIDCQYIEGISDPKLPSQDSMCRVAVAVVIFETSFRCLLHMVEHQSRRLWDVRCYLIAEIAAALFCTSPKGTVDFDMGPIPSLKLFPNPPVLNGATPIDNPFNHKPFFSVIMGLPGNWMTHCSSRRRGIHVPLKYPENCNHRTMDMSRTSIPMR